MGAPSVGTVEAHLARFDELNFKAYSKQNWELFAQIHADDVIVVGPDGHRTVGIEAHMEEMKRTFAWATDSRPRPARPLARRSGQ